MRFTSRLINSMDSITAQFALDLGDREAVVQSLLFLLRTATASEGLIDLAAKVTQPKDEFHAAMKSYFEAHAMEERGHVDWFKQDLTDAGVTIDPHVDWLAAAAAGSQYYAIQHAGPESLLGYMAFVEGNPMPLETVALLEELHGTMLFRTYRYHADNDRRHRDDLFTLINKVPAEMHDLIESSMFATSQFWLTSNERIRTGMGSLHFSKVT